MNIVRRFYLQMVRDIDHCQLPRANMLSTKVAPVVAGQSIQSEESIRHSYEEAIATLNSLQTNSNTIQKSVSQTHNTTCKHIQETRKYLERTGVKMETLDNLSVIHVAGTKGKGSTCALVESILRNLNVKTGFFSSPHLVHVNERIRLNGQPIAQQLFTEYFWNVYNRLEKAKEHATDMPPYFKFLTIMAYNVFLHEKVDVAIVEVGIGGEYDCTNIVRNTKTVGITSLGLEHTQLLGNTIEAIAWQKSGIIKPGSSVFTVQQPVGCETVIKSRADENNATFQYVPSFSEYKYKDSAALEEIIRNPSKKLNASLAIQLCYDWIKRNPEKVRNDRVLKALNEENRGLHMPDDIATGLLECFWPGRCQTLRCGNKKLYIDGAHTHDSLEVCVQWFKGSTSQSTAKKMLVFNVTGGRDGNDLLDILYQNVKFDVALFTPNISSLTSKAHDNVYTVAQPNKTVEHGLHWQALADGNVSKTFDCIADLFMYLDNNYGNEEIEILITGSLHLVGEVIRTIQQ